VTLDQVLAVAGCLTFAATGAAAIWLSATTPNNDPEFDDVATQERHLAARQALGRATRSHQP